MVGANPDEFKKIIAGGEGNGNEQAAAEGPESLQSLKAAHERSSATEEGQVVNIGIVEMAPNSQHTSQATDHPSVVNDKLDLADEAIMAVEKDEVVLEGEIKSD